MKNMGNKIKFSYVLTMVVIMPLLAATMAFAEHGEGDETTTNTEMKVKRAETVQMDATKSEMREEKADEQRLTRIKGVMRMMQAQITRTDKALGRLEHVMFRLES